MDACFHTPLHLYQNRILKTYEQVSGLSEISGGFVNHLGDREGGLGPLRVWNINMCDVFSKRYD